MVGYDLDARKDCCAAIPCVRRVECHLRASSTQQSEYSKPRVKVAFQRRPKAAIKPECIVPPRRRSMCLDIKRVRL